MPGKLRTSPPCVEAACRPPGMFLEITGISRALSDSPLDCPNRAGRRTAGRAVRFPYGRPFKKSIKRKTSCPLRDRMFWRPVGISRGLTNSPLDCWLRAAARALYRAAAPASGCAPWAGLALCGRWPCSGSLFPPQAAVACAAIPRTEAIFMTRGESPALFRTVHWTVRTGRDAGRPDELFDSRMVAPLKRA